MRYYEKIGLLPQINRTEGGYRNYSDFDCERIRTIKFLRNIDMSIALLSKYIAMMEKGDCTKTDRKDLLVEQHKHLVKKMTKLQRTLSRLTEEINML